MTLSNPFGVADGGDGQVLADKNAADALHKLQVDYNKLVAQAGEQATERNAQNLTRLVAQTNDKGPLGNGTTLVGQAHEQNKPEYTTLVEQAKLQDPPINFTTLVEQAKLQDPPINFTTIAEQARLQNPDAARYTEPPRGTTLIEQMAEQDKPEKGIGQFFKDDAETNLVANVSQVIARGFYLKEENAKALVKEFSQGKLRLGTVGEFVDDDIAKRFWHSSNDKTDVSKLVSNSETAYKMDSKPVVAALTGLEQQIDANILSARTGTHMTAEQRDRTRQLIENAAMIELAIARSKGTNNADAKDLVWGEGHSVNNLVKLAIKFGVNADNISQLKKLMEEFPHR